MSQELVAETGKCRLKGHKYPVRIYANDGGQSRDMIHGAYRDKDGWHGCAWDADGSPRFGTTRNEMSLVPIPAPQYFNIYTTSTGSITIGALYDTMAAAEKATRLHREMVRTETFKYQDGETTKVLEWKTK